MDLDEHASNWQRLGRRALREPFGWVFICRAFLYAGVSQHPPVETPAIDATASGAFAIIPKRIAEPAIALAKIARSVPHAGVSQHVPEFFRLCRLYRYPSAAGEL